MAGDAIELDHLLRTSAAIAKSYKRSEVHIGDIVFALRATVGKVLPVTSMIDGANLTQGTAKISPAKCVDTKFLLWAMRHSAVLRQIQLHQKGTTFMEITLSDLRAIKVRIPNRVEEQAYIGEILSVQEALITRYTSQLKKLRSLKTALMQDLLTGRKRVTALLEPVAEQEKKYAVG
jgi:type I restriction enzyme S subunit